MKETQMKRLILALMLVLLTVVVVACTYTNSSDNAAKNIPNRFVEIGDTLNGYAANFDGQSITDNVTSICTTYVVDRYSKVVYMFYFDGGYIGGTDFIPLYDKDGSIMIYDGPLPD